MSVTLGELMGDTDFTMTPRRQPKILNNLGQEVNTGPTYGKIQKKDYAVEKGTLYGAESQAVPYTHTRSAESVHAEQPGEGVPYTLIDSTPILGPNKPPQPGALFGDQNEQLQFNPYQPHSRFIDDRMSYSAMGPYNSNRLIPAYNYVVGASPAQMAINEAQRSQNILTDLKGNRFVVGPGGQLMTLPRETSFESNVNAQQRGLVQYGEFNPYPGWAGGKPRLENAVASDQSIAMGEPLNQRFDDLPIEGFSYGKSRGRGHKSDCASAMNHVMTCPVCSKYFQNDNKMYIAMMIMLIVVFSILLYMAMKK